MSHENYSLPPVVITQPAMPRVDPFAEQKAEARRQKRNSVAVGVMVALLVHVVLISIFMLIAIGAFERKLPPLVVVTEGYDPQEQLKPQEMHKRVTERPAPPSAHSSNPIVANHAVAPISAPDFLSQVEDPLDMGTGLGDADGLGFSGFGDGFGGTTFMGLQGGGKNIILVIDTSSSMPRNCGQKGIKAIKREINRTINGFSAETRFNIICYANNADAFRKDSVPATKQNRVDALKFMDAYFDSDNFNKTRTMSFGGNSEKGNKDDDGIAFVPIYADEVEGLEGTSGGSRIELGVVAAMERMPSTIFVLSDGEPNTRKNNRPIPHDDLVDLIKENHQRLYKGRKLVINTLSIRNLGEGFLRKVSGAFHGRHRKINPDRL